MSASSVEQAACAVRTFSELTKGDVEFAGGKGANLGELTRAGLPVPPRVVIGAPGYAALCEPHDLRGRIADELEGVEVETRLILDSARATMEAQR